jgi:hypothetical protein
MIEAEQMLLKIVPRADYVLKVPDEREYQNVSHFRSAMFPEAGAAAQLSVQKMVTLTDNLRAIKIKDPNAVFQTFLYAALSLLYQDKYRSNSEGEAGNVEYLLETIKCTLYSSDVDFQLIKGTGYQGENVQMKAMAARFFHLLQDQTIRLTVNRMKCAEWIMEHNPLLAHTFILLFRFILVRLEVKGSDDFKISADIDSFVNLV